ncbi:hypothetical protein N7512_007836 [Penicillium capsulatum]|nr:hypothetical protein N7512_007836 [Penicillium capsulatum]
MSADNAPKEYTTQAWLAIFGAFTSFFCTVGFLNSFGVFEQYYAADQLSGTPQSTIAWLAAIALFFLFSISVISGAMLDMFGPKIMTYVGSIGTVFAIMMTSLCKEFYQFLLAQGVLLGISMSLVTWPTLALVGQYIKKKRAAAMGIVLGGSSLGGVIWPIAIDQLLKNPRIGFPWTMRIITSDCSSNTGGRIEQCDSPREKVDRRAEAMTLFRKPSLQLLCLAMFFIYFGMFAPFFFTTSYAVKKGFSTSLAFYTVSIVNGTSFFGRVLPGIVADRLGKFNCCIISTIFAGIIALCWSTVDSVAGLVIWSAAYGFGSGGILSLQQACAAQVATPSTLGLAIGSVSGATALSAMASVPISGALAEKHGYLSLSLYSGISMLCGAVLLTMARMVQDRRLAAVV